MNTQISVAYMNVVVKSVVTVLCGLLLSPAAWAQQVSGIAGAVRDASGAALPGVTVEAASPALIEKVRTVITDGEGLYNIVDLRAGTYVVTFTLPGFRTLRRQDVTLTTGFTATVNADLELGALEETVTVTGAAPLVDIRNVRKQSVVSQELLDSLPSGSKHLNSLVALTPGFTGIVDPAGGHVTQIGGTFHGKGGTNVTVDGMTIAHAGGNFGYSPNTAIQEELVLQTSGISAESKADGVVINMIPKEGSNVFKVNLAGLYSNDSLQSNNLTDKVRARGFTTPGKILKVYNAQVSLGGPIKRDRVWFFGLFREWGNANQDGGIFYNKTQGTPFYTPDLERPANRTQWYESKAVRLTWQASQQHKFSFLVDRQRNCLCRYRPPYVVRLDAPEAVNSYHMTPDALYQGSWTSPVTSRLLLEAGAGAMIAGYPGFLNPGVEPQHISILEQSTGIRYNAKNTYNNGKGNQYNPRFSQRFGASYVTGSHNFKSGVQIEEAYSRSGTTVTGGNVNYTFRNAVPVSITQYATPYLTENRTKADMGIYAQDQWAIHRLTLNYGVRFEYFNGYVPPQHVAATPNGWVPERSFGEVKGVPSWKDWSPRVGAAYDLFGNGRTAAKVSLGRYVARTGTAVAGANNPIQTSVNQVTRSWTDTNGDYIPDCNLGNRAANGECGAMANQSFGGLNITTRYADDVLRGWGARGFNWDGSAEVQHEVRPGMSVSAGYNRNWFGNFTATDNLAVSPADFSHYCITAPVDARLPGGGGYQVCGLYDISLAKFGQVNSLITQASNYGQQTQANDFFSVGVNTRFGGGTQFGGGFDTGRSVTDTCFVVDSPQELLNCHVVTPFKGQTQVKLFGSHALPAGFVVSGIFQDMSGPSYTASYPVPTADILPSLGRNLAACGTRAVCTSTATVPLVAPQTLFENRIRRLDLRLTKLIRVARGRVQANVDVFNVLNASPVALVNENYGEQWRKPQFILEGRIVQFSGELSF